MRASLSRSGRLCRSEFERFLVLKKYTQPPICAQKTLKIFLVYLRELLDQLSFKDFSLAFGGELSGDNRRINLDDLIPWDKLKDDYAAQFCKVLGVPVKPFRIAQGAMIINARLGLTDEEFVEQINENHYLQFFIGFEVYQNSGPFEPSMMVYFRKRLPESVMYCKERIVRHGLNVIRSSASTDHDEHSSCVVPPPYSAADKGV